MACLARYQNKIDPDPTHKLFGSLRTKQQRLVRKLVSLLRVADALDIDYDQSVRNVRAKLQGDSIVLKVRSNKQTSYIAEEVAERSRMFSEVFGYGIQLKWED